MRFKNAGAAAAENREAVGVLCMCFSWWWPGWAHTSLCEGQSSEFLASRKQLIQSWVTSSPCFSLCKITPRCAEILATTAAFPSEKPPQHSSVTCYSSSQHRGCCWAHSQTLSKSIQLMLLQLPFLSRAGRRWTPALWPQIWDVIWLILVCALYVYVVYCTILVPISLSTARSAVGFLEFWKSSSWMLQLQLFHCAALGNVAFTSLVFSQL